MDQAGCGVGTREVPKAGEETGQKAIMGELVLSEANRRRKEVECEWIHQSYFELYGEDCPLICFPFLSFLRQSRSSTGS